jgi:cob(I)alamin adenosyltransferase
LIQVYTGNGKGKTTAALGLAVRAAGAGLKVYIAQFIKGKRYSELAALSKIKNIKLKQFGKGCFIGRKPSAEDIRQAQKCIETVREIVEKNIYDVIILDEVNVALNLKLIGLKDLLCLIEKTPPKTELVLTGRNAHPKIIQIADLVSRIDEVRHYFKKGVKARKGIEY